MEEIRNNYVEKSRYKDEDKRRAYKKNWAREKRMKVKLPKEETEQENSPLIKTGEKSGGDSQSEGQTVIIKKRKRPIVQPVVPVWENQAYFYVGFCKLRNYREEHDLSNFLDWMAGIQGVNQDFLKEYEKYRNA